MLDCADIVFDLLAAKIGKHRGRSVRPVGPTGQTGLGLYSPSRVRVVIWNPFVTQFERGTSLRLTSLTGWADRSDRSGPVQFESS